MIYDAAVLTSAGGIIIRSLRLNAHTTRVGGCIIASEIKHRDVATFAATQRAVPVAPWQLYRTGASWAWGRPMSMFCDENLTFSSPKKNFWNRLRFTFLAHVLCMTAFCYPVRDAGSLFSARLDKISGTAKGGARAKRIRKPWKRPSRIISFQRGQFFWFWAFGWWALHMPLALVLAPNLTPWCDL